MMKGRFIKTGVLFAAFLLILGQGFVAGTQAASVIFDWQNGVLDSGTGIFTFNILVEDITGLDPDNPQLIDLDGWNLDFDITRQGGPGGPFSFD